MKRRRRRHRRRYRPNGPRRRNGRSCRRRRRRRKGSRPQYRHIGAVPSCRTLTGSLRRKGQCAPQDGDAGCGGKICGYSFQHDAPLLSKIYANAAYAKNDRNLSAKFLSFSACTSCLPLAMMTRRGRRWHRPAGLMRFRFWLLNFFRRFRFLFRRRRRTRMMRTSLELRQLRACKVHIAKGICLRSHCKGRSAQRADNSSYDNRPFPNAHIEYPSFVLQFLVLIVSQNSLDSIHFVSQFLYNFVAN